MMIPCIPAILVQTNEMNMLLLKKIEELTLYAIKQERKVESERKLNRDQSEVISLQQQQINQLIERIEQLEEED